MQSVLTDAAELPVVADGNHGRNYVTWAIQILLTTEMPVQTSGQRREQSGFNVQFEVEG